MKKALSICLFLSLMAGCLLTGCDRTSIANSSSVAETTAATTTTEAVTEAETTAEESETEETETTAEESETEETETTAEESADAEDAETTTAAKEKDTSKDGNLWADFDNMSFKINGKTYTLGKTTLQELIDDGSMKMTWQTPATTSTHAMNLPPLKSNSANARLHRFGY